jgi:bidirectional [NiFe] hydrogenase diaphorase subunit
LKLPLFHLFFNPDLKNSCYILKKENGMTVQTAPSVATEPDSGPDLKFQLIDKTLKKFQFQQDALIEVLHAAQETFGHLDEEVLDYVSRQLQLPPSWVYGVATFYNFFSLDPQGDHVCVVCMGTACYVKGAGDIVTALEQEFTVKSGATTEDGKLTVHSARCLGNCSLAPMLTLDGEVLGHETPETTIAAIKAKAALAADKEEKA